MFSVRFLMVCSKGLDDTQQGFLGNSAAQDGLVQRQRSMNQLPRCNALTAHRQFADSAADAGIALAALNTWHCLR